MRVQECVSADAGQGVGLKRVRGKRGRGQAWNVFESYDRDRDLACQRPNQWHSSINPSYPSQWGHEGTLRIWILMTKAEFTSIFCLPSGARQPLYHFGCTNRRTAKHFIITKESKSSCWAVTMQRFEFRREGQWWRGGKKRKYIANWAKGQMPMYEVEITCAKKVFFR